jgi:hypothetical protein
MDDQGAAVVRFAPDQDAVESERVWLIALEPEESGARPDSFRFGRPKLADMTTTYQRYDDADLETVPAQIALRTGPVGRNPWWSWVLICMGAVLYAVWFLFAKPSEDDGEDASGALQLPETLTPFSVLALLHQVRTLGGLPDDQLAQLDDDVRRIEASHFGKAEGDDDEVDLAAIARHWLSRAG